MMKDEEKLEGLLIFSFFPWYRVLNSGPHAYLAVTLQLEPQPKRNPKKKETYSLWWKYGQVNFLTNFVLERQLHVTLPQSIIEYYVAKLMQLHTENGDRWREILLNTEVVPSVEPWQYCQSYN
jgi:hypothetical protein